MFFFFEVEENEKLINKLSAFSESLESNEIRFVREKDRIDIRYKEYGICSLKINKKSPDEIIIKINKILKSKNYKLIQNKQQFNRYWQENVLQKEFAISSNNDGELKKLANLIITLKDTFISDVIVNYKIKKIGFKDYKGFKDEQFEFGKRMTVFIGKNGCGKTSILDGVAVGIGAYLNGIDEKTDVKNIYKEDIRFIIDDAEDVPIRRDFPPTTVFFQSEFINQDINWSRTKASLKSSTNTKDSNIVTTAVRQLVDDIRNDDNRQIILPIFSYHGVGRVANYTRDMRYLERSEKISRFFGYKDCLKPASNYKIFVNWYRKMKFLEFEKGKKILSLHAVESAIVNTLKMLTEEEEYRVSDVIYFEGELSVRFDNGDVLPISHLSDGYKDIIGIISDIAYRMAVLNSKLGEDILIKTPGIVLIDEIELHLHPKWQQNILRILKNIFPKVQFIVTTHSPLIVSTTEENEAVELINKDNKVTWARVGNPKEWYMSDILRNVFEVK